MLCYVSTVISKTLKQAAFFSAQLKHLTICGLLEEYATYMHPLHCITWTHMQSRSHYQVKQTMCNPVHGCCGLLGWRLAMNRKKSGAHPVLRPGPVLLPGHKSCSPPSTPSIHQHPPQNTPATERAPGSAPPQTQQKHKNTKTQQKRKRQIRFSQTALTME